MEISIPRFPTARIYHFARNDKSVHPLKVRGFSLPISSLPASFSFLRISGLSLAISLFGRNPRPFPADNPSWLKKSPLHQGQNNTLPSQGGRRFSAADA